MLSIDVDLIRKYDKPGPRYTSYPTAPQFSPAFTHEDFKSEIIRTNRGKNRAELSLYFHLPFCDTLCFFCGCNMIVTHNRDRIRRYLKYLKKELDHLRGLIAEDRKAIQLHWGGGTPTHLSPDEIADLIAYITKRFEIAPGAEISCEIDPRELTRDHLAALRSGGFNRISMGVQDVNAKVQKAVNRIQPEALTRQVAAWVRESGFESLNVDLIYGLPFQTADNFEKTVDTIIDIHPDRIALFNFAYVPWMKKHQKRIHQEDLPSPEEKLRILKMSVEKLTGAGYVFIGMDHFAKPDDELAAAQNEKRLYRNFQGYSTHAGADLYAMGITSISQFGQIYAQNEKGEKAYFAALDKGTLPTAKGCRLNADDILRRKVITRLMCDFELDFRAVEDEFNIDFESYFRWGLGNLRQMRDDRLIIIKDKKLRVTEMGRLLIRNIAMNFDGYLERQEDQARYSRTV
ncbi:MAG: oxygen-independent coproporphyrinogen III oxidase [Thermodesulfobacteriota bacterium]